MKIAKIFYSRRFICHYYHTARCGASLAVPPMAGQPGLVRLIHYFLSSDGLDIDTVFQYSWMRSTNIFVPALAMPGRRQPSAFIMLRHYCRRLISEGSHKMLGNEHAAIIEKACWCLLRRLFEARLLTIQIHFTTRRVFRQYATVKA